MSRRITMHMATTARWTFGAGLLGLFAQACNPSPHIDPPGSTSSGGTGGGGGSTIPTGGGGSTTPTGGGGSGPSACESNADCAYPKNLCDVASGHCVECLLTADCSAKPGTVCSKAKCECPTLGDTYCAEDVYGAARCVDVTTAGKDCGSCGHQCFGSCKDQQCTDAWEPTAQAGAPSPRTRHVAVWTGKWMIVWGGVNGGTYLGDGAMYDPETRAWTPMSGANAPSPRDSATAIWTGTKMIVWGGRDTNGALGDGKIFDPSNGEGGSWTSVANQGMPAARYQHTAVWMGNATARMLVWGGFNGNTEMDTGSSYGAGDDAWFDFTPPAPAPRRLHTAVWDEVKGRVIVFGGLGFDPNSGTTTSLNSGGTYGPNLNGWTDLQAGSPPAPRYEHSAVWTGTHMIVWGGQNSALGSLNDGASFDGNADVWSPMMGPPPSARRRHTAVFFSALNRMVVWGGVGPNNAPLGDGGIFDTSGAATWLDPGVPGGPDPSVDHTAVAAGSRMIIWGGTGPSGVTNKGAVLDMTKIP